MAGIRARVALISLTVSAILVLVGSVSAQSTQMNWVATNNVLLDSLQSAGSTCPIGDTTSDPAPVGNVGAKPVVTHRLLLSYDISEIPIGSTILKADLALFFDQVVSPDENFNISISRVSNMNWDPPHTTWDTYRCYGSTPKLWCNIGGDITTEDQIVNDIFGEPVPGGGRRIDIIPIVQRVVGEADKLDTGSILHILLKSEHEANTAERYIDVSTLAGSSRPKIQVEWIPPAPGPTPTWVDFADETDKRLVGPTTGPEGQEWGDCLPMEGPPTSPWLACDIYEKDMTKADFDGDGDLDIIVVRKEPFSVAGAQADVLLLNNDGKLEDRSDLLVNAAASDARDVFAGDLDNDGFADLALATTCLDPPKFYENLGTSGARCDNWAGLTLQQGWAPTNGPENGYRADPRFCGMAGGDIDEDGDIDLFFANYATPCDAEPPSGGISDEDSMLMNEIVGPGATGRFAEEGAERLSFNTITQFGTSAEIRDLDGDGHLDIVKNETPETQYALNTGVSTPPEPDDFTFGPFGLLPSGIAFTYFIAVEDLNGDGIPDFYAVKDDEDEVVFGPPSNFVLNATSNIRTSDVSGNVKFGDVDGDGDFDVAVADVDVEFKNSCNICQNGVSCSQNLASCSEHLDCVETNQAVCDGGFCHNRFEQGETCTTSDDCQRRRFAILENDGNGTLVDPWPASDPQPWHTRSHDFEFLDINGDGCLDLFMGLCRGYKVFIQQCAG
jgi:hypothetical protein